MSLPEPQIALVISYSYLWHREDAKGETEGRKHRPAAIVAHLTDKDGALHVAVLPITTTEPENMAEALEIPAPERDRIGLPERSWIICSEYNQFEWPGVDLRPVPGTADVFAYGLLSREFWAKVKAKMQFLRDGRKLKTIRRE